MGPSKDIRILLVDDQADNIFALEAILEREEYDLVKADSGEEALRLLLERDFALILLDVRMPRMDGYETAALIRKRQRSAHTPIIFITAGRADEEQLTRGYALGAVDYIHKPIIAATLKSKVSVFAELHRKNINLIASEEKYRELYSRATDAIVVFGGERHEILDANEAALKLYGYSREELLGMTADDLAAEPSCDRTAGMPASDAAPLNMPLLGAQKSKSGRVFPCETTYAVVAFGDRRVVQAQTRDITERRQAEEAQRLREREEMQKRFVATVSHELRTPIAAIKASAESLRRGGDADPKDRAQYMRIIESQADRLAGLVEDLLVLSEIEAGKARPEPSRISLEKFVLQFAPTMAPLAARKDLEFLVHVAEPVEVWTDQSHLSRILQNLIDNAIKYNKKGGLVSVTGRAVSAREAQVTIQDTGIGIRPDDLENIFQPFFRTPKARQAAVKGTGLGLHIIKNLVESNGGRIWAENAQNGGSAFHFTLPLADGGAAASAS